MLFPRKRVRRNGLEYDLDCRELIDYRFSTSGWESETMNSSRNHVKHGFVTLEVGANVGAHTLVIAKLSGNDGIVHAVEPTDFARAKLLKNLNLNPEIAEPGPRARSC